MLAPVATSTLERLNESLAKVADGTTRDVREVRAVLREAKVVLALFDDPDEIKLNSAYYKAMGAFVNGWDGSEDDAVY